MYDGIIYADMGNLLPVLWFNKSGKYNARKCIFQIVIDISLFDCKTDNKALFCFVIGIIFGYLQLIAVSIV